MKWSLGLVLVAISALASCGLVTDGDGPGREAPDAGGSGTADLDGGSGGNPPFEASSPPSIPLPESGPPPPPPDAGPTPPSYCVPPCLWDAIRECTPPAAAVCESSSPSTNRSVVCDKRTGWAQSIVQAGQAGTPVTISHDGIECLTVNSGGASPIPGSIYSRGSDTIAYLASDRTEARCGGFNTPVIALEPNRPECDRWTGPNSGRPFPKLSCESTVSGDCNQGP